MPAVSRYAKVIQGARMLTNAADILRTMHRADDEVGRAVAITRAKSNVSGALVQLEQVAEECSMARGMYASNRNIRDTLVAAGEALRQQLPLIVEQMTKLDNITGEQIPEVITTLRTIAANVGLVSFNPSTGRKPTLDPADVVPPQ